MPFEGFNRYAQGGDDVQLERLQRAVDAMPGLREALEARGLEITDINDIFGYGSLPDQPHYKTGLTVQKGLLEGCRRDLVIECSRSGTNATPGLVFGLERQSGAVQAGGILSYGNLTLEQRAENLELLRNRETMQTKGAHVYTFAIMDVEAEDGSIKPCITCMSDTNAPGYAGDANFDERAQRIARAHNAIYVPGESPEMTDEDSTVSSRNDIRTSRAYFNQCAIIPLIAAQRKMEQAGQPANDFEARYRAALAQDADYLHQYEVAIESARRALPRDEQRFLAEAELIDTQGFFGMATEKELMQGLIEGLREEIAELKSPGNPSHTATHRIERQDQDGETFTPA